MLGVVKSVEILYFDITSGNTVQTLSLTKGQDTSSCVPFVSYKCISGFDAAEWRVDVYFSAGTQVKVERTDTAARILGHVIVIEFDPNKVRVQQGSFTCVKEVVAPQNTVISLAQSVDITKAAAACHYRTSLTNINNWDTHSLQFSLGTSNLNAYRFQGNGTALYGHYYIFESLDGTFTVQQKQLTFTGLDSVISDTLSNSVNVDKSFMIGSVYTTNASNNASYSMFYARIVNSTTIEAERYSASSYTTFRAFVIEFHDDTVVHHGVANIDSVQTIVDITIPAVDTEFSAPCHTHSWSFMDGSSSDIQRNIFWLRMTSTTNLRAERQQSGITHKGRYQLIEFAKAPGYYFAGYVTELGSPATRTVRAYHRDTGEMLGEATSSGVGGYYYLETTYSGSQYLITLDDPSGDTYNLLGYDLMVPTTISGG